MESSKINLEMFYNLTQNRSSKRMFSSEPLSFEKIKELLECASFAPSWCNVQPWRCYIANGDLIETLKKEFAQAAKNQEKGLELSYKPQYTRDQMEKKQKADEKLLTSINKSSTDLQARVELVKRNWTFFDAPQALFLTVSKNLLPYALLDLGCFLQNFLLAAEVDNLGACPQAALAEFPHVVRRYFPISNDEIIVCGVSFGYAKKGASINQIKTDRQDLKDFINIKD